MTASSSAAQLSDAGPLCLDAPIGRIVTFGRDAPTCMPTYLSIDIVFSWRDTKRAKVVEAAHGYRFGGPFLVLGIQVSERFLSRRRGPSKWVTSFDQFGDPHGRWPLDRFQLRRGLKLADLLRVAELSKLYNRNMNSPIDGPSAAVFIPREQQDELRNLAARIAGNG